MRDRIFQEAYDRVRSRFADDVWLSMQPNEITRAIYDEMRTLDAERNAADAAVSTVHALTEPRQAVS